MKSLIFKYDSEGAFLENIFRIVLLINSLFLLCIFTGDTFTSIVIFEGVIVVELTYQVITEFTEMLAPYKAPDESWWSVIYRIFSPGINP